MVQKVGRLLCQGEQCRSNPEGMTVNSQGREPLGERQIPPWNAEGVAEILPPFQGYTICGRSDQGLTPLAIHCRRFAAFADSHYPVSRHCFPDSP